MGDRPSDFDPQAPEQREIAGEAAEDRSDFLTLMGHAYRGELGRTTAWRTRIDRTTNWGVVVTATLLTWAFSSASRPHYVLLVGMVMVTVFLGIEVRRYRMFDIWRSRVRLYEENVFANALDPDGVEQTRWRELLSEDLRNPTIKTPLREALSRRLRRVYLPLLSVLVGAWVVRLAVFAETGGSLLITARVGSIPGAVIVALVGAFYCLILALAFWPIERQAKGNVRPTEQSEDWK
ncbi:MAG: DUF2270 domain-containing protein [Halanaeroarchaeum sp.]